MKKKKIVHKRKAVKKSKVVHKPKRESGPEYTVNVNDPKALRKDLLEGLREVIIYMQSHEKFRKIQEEKVILFTQLKTEVKDLHTLVDRKLRGFFPKGKLQSMKPDAPRESEVKKAVPKVKEVAPVPSDPAKPRVVEGDFPPNELDELESQLKDIEGQLDQIK